MDIYEALKQITPKKMSYFKWKHNLEYDQKADKRTVAEFMENLGVENLDYYIKWERSEEYLRLVNLALQTNFANDLNEIYMITSERAKSGNDEKAVKLLMDLQKQIASFNKENNKATLQAKEYNPLDELEL